jgi:hypothetical protein
MTNFFSRHIATVALAVELSTLGAVIAFLVATTLGHSVHSFA